MQAMKIFLFRLVALIAVLMLPVALLGQAESGSIVGTVKDATGAVVAGATITVKNVATGAQRTAQSAGVGQYNIGGLQVGTYEITVTSGNFAPYRTNAEVTVGGTATVDAQLATGQASTTVEVVAGAGGTEVNTQTQELSQLVNTQQMSELPSLTRNPYDFVSISGNVSSADRTATGGDQNTTGRGVGYALNGQRTSGTEVLLDGVENLDLFTATTGEQVPLDSVQEYRVITNNFDSQYGRASGGVVNVTTRSGSNDFHGSAWEFNRLAAYTANTYANDSQNAFFRDTGGTGPLPAQKGGYTRNQFGFAIGGPIFKDKLFFFESTEWLRVRSNASLQAYVPTPQLLATLPANVQSYFAAFGSNAFNFASVDAASGLGLVNFSAPADAGGGVPQNTYRTVGRLDFNPTDKTQMFFRYAQESVNDFIGADYASPYSQYDVGDSSYNNSGLFSLNHSFSPNFLTNTKISFSRLNFANTYDKAQQNVPELLLASGATINNFPVQLPGLFAQFAGAGGLPFGGPQNALQLTHDDTWSKGAHTIRFGGIFDYQQINRAFGAFAQGLELLGTNVTSGLTNLSNGQLTLFEAAVDPQGQFPCQTDPATGQPIQTSSCSLALPATSPSFARSFRYKDWAMYLQDSWKATPRLTLNFGTRYEHYGVQHNNNQALDSNFYYGAGANIYERIRSGSVQLAPQSPVGQLWAPVWGTVAPRVGFAYDIFGDGKSSLRGGFGISYERNFGNVTFNVIQNPPNYASIQLLSPQAGPVTTSNFGPLGAPSGSIAIPSSSLRHVAQNMNVAQTQFYSMSLERQLARNTVFALEYAGAHGVHLYDIAAYNQLGGGQAYLGDSFDPSLLDYSRPNNQYTGINTRGSGGTSRYNALNLRFQSQNLHNTGLSLTANYTYAHAMDDLSSTFSDSTGGASNGIGNLGYLDPRDPRLDWGSSDFDIRHRVALSMIWQTPWLQSGNGWKRQVLGGYTIVPVFTAHTGVPFSIFDSSMSLNGGAGYGIPRYLPSSPHYQLQDRFGSKHRATERLYGADSADRKLSSAGSGSWSIRLRSIPGRHDTAKRICRTRSVELRFSRKQVLFLDRAGEARTSG
jgi:outer membrane receptor protein involved in Fe transport